MKRIARLNRPTTLTYCCVFVFTFFASLNLHAQIGINTTTPNPSAMLDVEATDKGILVPRVSLSNVTDTMLDGTNTAATGLLIYNTNATVTGGSGVGYYYFNGTNWEKLVTSATATSDHDFYEEGTTSPPDDINDDMYTQGNIAIGQTTTDYPLQVTSTASRAVNINTNGTAAANYGIYSEVGGTNNGLQYGDYNFISNTGSGQHFGQFNSLAGTGSGLQYGVYNSISNSGIGAKYGVYNRMGISSNADMYGTFTSIYAGGTGTKYGTYNYLNPALGGTHYGIYSETLRAGSYAGYFLGAVSVGTTTTNNYILPPSRGTANQVMQTDGLGNLSWVDGSSLGSDDADFYVEGTTNVPTDINDDIFTQGNVAIGKNMADYKVDIEENTGTRGLNLSVGGSGNSDTYSAYLSNTNSGTGIHYGIQNTVSGNDDTYGVYSNILPLGTGASHYGSYNNFTSIISVSGNYYGTYNRFNQYTLGSRFGVYNDFQSPGTFINVGLSNQATTSNSTPLNIGVDNNISSSGNQTYGMRNTLTQGGTVSTVYGVYTTITGISNGNGYGYYVDIDPSYVGPQYGVYSEALRTTGTTFAGYFLGNVGIGTTTSNTYILPPSRGTADQVMQTDGSGNVSWVDSSSVGGDDADWLEEGTGLAPDDVNDDIYTFGNVAIGQSTANYNLDVTENVSSRTINLSNSATSGIISGVFNIVSGTATQAQRGVYNLLSGSGNNIHIGTYNNLNGSGTGNKYGSYNSILNTAGGTHYGVYSSALKTGSFAGYFLGNVYIGTDGVNGYTFPGVDGTANQIMETDGAGNVSWIDTPASFWTRTGSTLDVANTADDIQFTSDQTSITFANPGTSPSPMIEMFTSGSINNDQMVIAHSSSFLEWGLEYRDDVDSFVFRNPVDDRVEINLRSNVGNPYFPLRVYGTARAEDFESDTTTYPDYVFEAYYDGGSEMNPAYRFKSLSEVANFIRNNGHLPGVKSYEEIEQAGMTVNLAETSVTNLEKIEELFLYAIELQEKNEALKEKQKALELRLQKIEEILSQKD